MRRASRCLIPFLLVVGARAGAGQTVQAPQACRDRAPALVRALEDIHQRQRNIGLSALVVHRGVSVASVSLGYADLDAPIQRYVPAFPVKPGGAITLRLLASHLAGIRHWRQERTPALYARHFDDVSGILALFKDDTLIARPGTADNYSSYGYNLIGAAIQSASGVKYEDYVRREIIDRLGLKDTGFDDVRRVLPHRARRYSYFHPWTFVVDSSAVYRVPDWDYSHNMAGGNMYTTAADLARFGRAVMQPGLITRKSLDLLYTRVKVDTVEASMSFGFFVTARDAPRRVINIGGSNAGVQSGLFVYPDDDLIIAVLSNTWGIGARSGEMNGTLLQRLAAICMGWPEPPPVT